MLGEFKGANMERSYNNETRANLYKGMTPPSIQRLKVLG